MSVLFAKEFAETYLNRRVLVAERFYAKIVGYHLIYSDCLIVQPEDQKFSLRYSRESMHILSKGVERVRIIDLSQVVLVDAPKNLQQINPYPDRCNKCKQPARKIDKIMLCSNRKCKSKKFNNIYKNKKNIIIIRDIDIDGFVICPICLRQAVRGVGPLLVKNDILICNHNHKWFHNWSEGEKLWADNYGYLLYTNNSFKLIPR